MSRQSLVFMDLEDMFILEEAVSAVVYSILCERGYPEPLGEQLGGPLLMSYETRKSLASHMPNTIVIKVEEASGKELQPIRIFDPYATVGQPEKKLEVNAIEGFKVGQCVTQLQRMITSRLAASPRLRCIIPGRPAHTDKEYRVTDGLLFDFPNARLGENVEQTVLAVAAAVIGKPMGSITLDLEIDDLHAGGETDSTAMRLCGIHNESLTSLGGSSPVRLHRVIAQINKLRAATPKNTSSNA